MNTAPYTLYLLWDHDRLLYVGQTRRWPRRLKEHARTKPWWPQVTETEAHDYPDRLSACQAECALIDHLEPVHARPYTGPQRRSLDPENGKRRAEARERRTAAQYAWFASIHRQASYAGVAVAEVENTELSVTTRLVYVWLSSWGGLLPSPGEAAAALGISEATADEAYEDLLACGYVVQDAESAA